MRGIACYSLSDSNSGDTEKGFAPELFYYSYIFGLNFATNGTVPGVDGNDRKFSLIQPGGGRVEVQRASVQLDSDHSNSLVLSSISAFQE